MSANIKITINRKQLESAWPEMAKRALEAAGLQAEGDAKLELENAPRRIDTGLLRNSITHAVSGQAPAITSYRGDNPSKYGEGNKSVPTGSYSGNAPDDPKDKLAVYIGTNVEYAAMVHEGTDRMKPNRFLKNALQKNGETYLRIIETYLKKE